MSGFGYRARRRWALVVLLVGLPIYVVLAASLVEWLGRPGVLAELLIYVVLGIIWAMPLRAVFRGVARPEPGQAARDRRVD